MNKHASLVTLLLCLPSLAAAQENAVPVTPPAPGVSVAAPPASATGQASPAIEKAETERGDSLPYRTMFYEEKEFSYLQKAADAFRRGLAAPDAPEASAEETGTLFETLLDRKPVFYTYPQFFLDSVVYYSPTLWTVWVNGAKITQDTPQEGAPLTIAAISQKAATFTWKPPANELFAWKASSDNRVIVDERQRKITFSLHPNQTFSTFSMRVLEGRLQPVLVDYTDLQSRSGTQAPSPALGTLTMPPAGAPAADSQNTGLGGLIHRYERINQPKEQ